MTRYAVETRGETLAVKFEALWVPTVTGLAHLGLGLGWLLVQNSSCRDRDWRQLLSIWGLWLRTLLIKRSPWLLVGRNGLIIDILPKGSGWGCLKICISKGIVACLWATPVTVNSCPMPCWVLVVFILVSVMIGIWWFSRRVHYFSCKIDIRKLICKNKMFGWPETN